MFGSMFRTGLTWALVVFSAAALAHDASSHKSSLNASKDARPEFAFSLPTPGSYELPPIMRAAGGLVLDEKGVSHDLGEILRERVTVLAFIYTRCGDVCPMASLQISL